MKQLTRIKLNQLNKAELSERELNRLLGGDGCCICGCRGISTNYDNGNANTNGGVSGLIPGDNGGGTGLGSFG